MQPLLCPQTQHLQVSDQTISFISLLLRKGVSLHINSCGHFALLAGRLSDSGIRIWFIQGVGSKCCWQVNTAGSSFPTIFSQSTCSDSPGCDLPLKSLLPQLLLCFLGTPLPPWMSLKSVSRPTETSGASSWWFLRSACWVIQVGASVQISELSEDVFQPWLGDTSHRLGSIHERYWLLISHVTAVFGSSVWAISKLQVMDWLQASARHVYMIFFRMDTVHELYLSVVSPWTSKHWQQPVPSYPCCLAKIRLCAPELSARPLSCFPRQFYLTSSFSL